MLLITLGAINILGLINKKSEPIEIKTNEQLIIKTTEEMSTTTKTTKVRTTSKKTAKSPVKSGTYKLTHYGADCKGCSGITASGYNVKNTMFYNDKQYGKLRICATSRQFRMYTILKLKNYKLGEVDCIVLDRGVGNGVIDLLVSSEKAASKLGIQKIDIEVIRNGK